MEFLLIPLFFVVVYVSTQLFTYYSVGEYQLARWEKKKGYHVVAAERKWSWLPGTFVYELKLFDKDKVERRCLLKMNKFFWFWHYQVHWLTEGSPRE